ncbi:hypothetical protein C7B79_22380 [Chroococcidiopsis cubana CCALA 043]|nr:hypothetical protein C7B79_22380 [Chroococcidiopsis cubana CCALA 043]
MGVAANKHIELQASDSKGDRNFKASDRASVFSVKLLLFVNKFHFFIGSSGFSLFSNTINVQQVLLLLL